MRANKMLGLWRAGASFALRVLNFCASKCGDLGLSSMLDEGERRLRMAGVDSPRVNAEWLLAAALGVRRSELPLLDEREICDQCRRRWDSSMELRCRRIPLQHILGTVPFCGIELAVTGDALVPRPETEMLVDMLIGRFAKNPPKSIVDLGTGGGACILALGNAFTGAALAACDISDRALELARRNEKLCGLGGRVSFGRSDWFSSLDGSWDLIVANPPYLTEDEWSTAEPEVRHWDPKLALVGGGKDGSDALRRIISDAPNHLTPMGTLAVEMGISQGTELATLAESVGFRCEIVKDLNGFDRFMICTHNR
ncbi:MAG: peptide chain release factor N(5)-glutamine methyltransferase [Puniceicoccales bacterium]|jgi:release factor glutamine methyltransferase|nr:peptide chain release factor N(5)-glutamine methyltransferase [Puniceicoccales bacterium]